MPTTATSTPGARRRAASRPEPRRAAADLAWALVPLLMVATITWRLLPLPASYILEALALHGVTTALILGRLPAGLPGAGLGAANRVTLARAVLVLSLAPLTLHPLALDAAGLWWTVGVSAAAMALDGVDGPVARRTGGTTRFGARFDMELDAFLILVLSLLAWRSGRVGVWVVLIGTLRYLFVAAGWLWPVLAADLPPSFRRKTVCVIQGVALLVCLGPVVPAALAPPVAAVALGALVLSFATDVRWLVRSRRSVRP